MPKTSARIGSPKPRFRTRSEGIGAGLGCPLLMLWQASEGWWMAVQESVGPAIRRSRRRTKAVVTSDRQAVAHPLLPPALESLFRLIAEPILKLEAAPDGQRAVREIGLLLGDVLDWLEEDQT